AIAAHAYVTPPAEATETAPPTQAVEFPLNLNTATAAQLQQLPGIGEVLASEIVEFRRINGNFINKQQLLEVAGIGEATLSEIEAYLYIEHEH
ncbi:ComEA family DNA-binding protein, partial [Klebsiella pneumoniae]|uniref:ComEA family DNA-binding protein n=1 Tax=Klebsiella pneumoniae TaxID=573 RepID=UPI0025A30130